jgi:hypothetical protein
MERACFDYMILEHTPMVSEAWGGTAEMSLSQALQVPKHDPVPLAAMIAAVTSRLGIVAKRAEAVPLIGSAESAASYNGPHPNRLRASFSATKLISSKNRRAGVG